MSRILGILMLSGVLGVGPGFWTQLHLATCCAQPHVAAVSSSHAQICLGWSHDAATCPICMALHAALTAPSAASSLNPLLPISYCQPIARLDVQNHRRIAADCRGPPDSAQIAWA